MVGSMSVGWAHRDLHFEIHQSSDVWRKAVLDICQSRQRILIDNGLGISPFLSFFSTSLFGLEGNWELRLRIWLFKTSKWYRKVFYLRRGAGRDR